MKDDYKRCVCYYYGAEAIDCPQEEEVSPVCEWNVIDAATIQIVTIPVLENIEIDLQ